MSTLKNELIGTWSLLSYIEIPIKGGDSCFPLGKSPKGLLMYSTDGYMSVQISASEDIRDEFWKNNILVDERTSKSILHDYIAFSGRYTVDNNYACVNYFVEVSAFPKWEGSKQIRKIDFEGDVLYQRSVDPIMSDGQLMHAHMTWQRASREVEGIHLLSEQVVHFDL